MGVLNLLITMHISHDLCQIMQIFWNNDVVLIPGGEQSFCNDFCVNLCVNGSDDFQCEITNCLNKCNLHFGNEQMVQPTDYVMYDDDDNAELLDEAPRPDAKMPPPPRPDHNPQA